MKINEQTSETTMPTFDEFFDSLIVQELKEYPSEMVKAMCLIFETRGRMLGREEERKLQEKLSKWKTN